MTRLAEGLASIGLTLERRAPCLLAYGMIAGVAMAAALVIAAAHGNDGRVRLAAITPGLLGLMAMLTAAALLEESFFRGAGVLRHRDWQWAWVIGSSVAFSLSHAPNPGFGWMAFTRTTIAGATYALVAIIAGRVWAAWGIHTGWNVGLALLGVPVSGRTSGTGTALGASTVLPETTYGPEATPACLALWCIAFVVMLAVLVYRQQTPLRT